VPLGGGDVVLKDRDGSVVPLGAHGRQRDRSLEEHTVIVETAP